MGVSGADNWTQTLRFLVHYDACVYVHHTHWLWVCNDSSISASNSSTSSSDCKGHQTVSLSPFVLLTPRSWDWGHGLEGRSPGDKGQALQRWHAAQECCWRSLFGIAQSRKNFPAPPRDGWVWNQISIVYLAEGSAVSPRTVASQVTLSWVAGHGSQLTIRCFMQFSISVGFRSLCHQGISGSGFQVRPLVCN